MSIDYYNRQGQPIEMMEWSLLLHTPGYKRVALTEVCEGIEVSTVWLGLDHDFFGHGPPLIFETMIFVTLDEPIEAFGRIISREGTETYRYSTENQAQAHHDQLVAELKGQIADAGPHTHGDRPTDLPYR